MDFLVCLPYSFRLVDGNKSRLSLSLSGVWVRATWMEASDVRYLLFWKCALNSCEKERCERETRILLFPKGIMVEPQLNIFWNVNREPTQHTIFIISQKYTKSRRVRGEQVQSLFSCFSFNPTWNLLLLLAPASVT